MMLTCIVILLSLFIASLASQPSVSPKIPDLFSVEGRILFHGDLPPSPSGEATRISLDYGKHTGFVSEDGSFEVDGIPFGSYILEVLNIHYLFDPIRVDITSKGKIRARKLNLLQPNAVVTLPYPLSLQPRQRTSHFRIREESRMTDVLMNPMVIMLIVAFILMVVTPKLTSQDPQLQQEMQNIQMPKMEMPDLSDLMANLFGGAPPPKKSNKKSTGSSGPKRIS